MRVMAILGAAVLVSGLVLVGTGIGATQEEKKPPEGKEAKPPLTLIRVDISEEVDGREYTLNTAQYSTVLMLWHAGLDFESKRKTSRDKDLEKYKPRKTGDPDFVVKGETKARMDRRATWYDDVVGYVYKGEAEISIEDSAGKEVATYRLSLERSGRDRDQAIRKTLERLGRYAALAVVECEEIRSRIPEKRKEKLKEIHEQIRKEIAEFGGTLEKVEPEDPPEEEGSEKGKEGETRKKATRSQGRK
jgi:hypothetical protein